ncbi:hypothetical protein PoB_004257800 [Plakobranchus ocellatus]|uniref:Uncharacterized protein n=1 Tax=Plakobranchus ocellatus TaxID=259542 RepID=A0AAV4B8Z9_9GAST|nr:hypothetical protein PoB_004257800 [Plakobranchus ocellatus]
MDSLPMLCGDHDESFPTVYVYSCWEVAAECPALWSSQPLNSLRNSVEGEGGGRHHVYCSKYVAHLPTTSHAVGTRPGSGDNRQMAKAVSSRNGLTLTMPRCHF